jgi:hypothetical protein
LTDQLQQSSRSLSLDSTRESDRSRADSLGQGAEIDVFEGWATGEEEVEGGADGVDVGADIEWAPEDVFRRCEFRCAFERRRPVQVSAVSGGDGNRQAKVPDLDGTLLIDEAIRRLNVPVEDTGRQGSVKALNNLKDGVNGLGGRQRSLSLNTVLERTAREQFHRDYRDAAYFIGLEHVDAVRVTYSGGSLAFGQEPRAILGSAKALVQHLEGYPATLLDLRGFVDFTHASATDGTVNAIRSESVPRLEAPIRWFSFPG